ncbi:NAD(P)H-dependent oxidoreductase, partial [Bacteroides intestinalis]
DAIKEMDDVAIFNLYEMPDENILNMDAWSRIISHANAVIYQFPFYWMSAPSLLKKWQDGIFTYLAKTPAVAGKPLLVATTTGSEFDAYRSGGRNRFTVDELLRPYQCGAVHAGMIWQTPFVVYGMGTPDAEKNIALAADLYKKRVMVLIGKNKSEDSW